MTDEPLSVAFPTPEPMTTEPPESLGEVGREKWHEVAAHLRTNGIDHVTNADALELYARTWERIQQYETTVDEEGETFEDAQGNLKAHPLLAEIARLNGIIYKYQKEFGLTPASRKALNIKPQTTTIPSRKRG